MIIKNNILPVSGFGAMAVWPFIFVRKDYLDDLDKYFPRTKDYRYNRTINHEKIHFKQQKELLIIGFYLIYLLNWLYEIIKVPFGGDKKAYSDIIFEKEANAHERDMSYLNARKSFSFLKYIGNGSK